MDPRHLFRLQEEQRRAIQETKGRIDQYEKFKSDYKALQHRLKTLPDKISYDVMVPFGKYAFMPGKIVHTNEILVLLGDNWFVERSAKQAYHIADRRIQELDKRIKEMQEQYDLLAPRLGITSELQAQAQGIGDIKEIIEEFDEEKEKMWDEQHKKNVQRYHEKEAKKNLKIAAASKDKSSMTESNVSIKSDEELWKRLDVLEKQEIEKGELHSSFEDESEDEDNDDKKSPGRRVSWIDEKSESVEEDFDDSDDADDADVESTGTSEEDSDEASVLRKQRQKTITFSHTKTASPSQEIGAASDSSSINSPADIYKLFAPKSILKKSHSATENDSSHVKSTNSSQSKAKKAAFGAVNVIDKVEASQPVDLRTEDCSSSNKEKAFTGLVVEKPLSQDTPKEPQVQSGGQETKRMSRFKAQRMKQAPS